MKGVSKGVGVVVVACAAVTCFPDPKPVSWEPLDLDALKDDLANPTGEVNEDTSKEVAEGLIANEEALREVLRFIELIYSLSQDDQGGLTAVVPRGLDGTNIFMRIACPGSDVANPDTSFEEGELRLDSPGFTDEFLETFEVVGDVHMDFTKCRIGPFEYEGSAPAHYDTAATEAAIDLRLDFVDQRTDGEGSFHYPLFTSLDDGVQMLYTLESGETLVLEWVDDFAMVDLRGRNGLFLCTFDVDAVDLICAPP